ncbi:GNAT family protein [Rossellomorea sp. YZS02]|uniref:GNAT family N-acetyltransferase n=1 Tax=Rossellomorea sp. YZS02 TaxID=3097358 RepID=UPI002A14AC37|nr:GNAT family protein [Rossellomorea sp. YZS02]MDX8342412.1 GNAT family protein [Rossellomorea sp. YZS02]
MNGGGVNQSPFIKGKQVLLRQPKESDILDRFSCGCHKEIVRMYGGNTRNLQSFTMEEARAFVEKILTTKYNWCIEYLGHCIGQARLTVNEEDQRARYAIGIFDPSVLGKGLGTEVTQLLLSYAFEELRLHRVDLRVLEYNHRAIACYEKCGFVKEGVEREGALIEGKFESDVFMSILEREYSALNDKGQI